MKKGIVACLLTGLFLTSCTNVVVWTPGQAIMTTLILLAIVVGLVTYGYYKIKEWWKKK